MHRERWLPVGTQGIGLSVPGGAGGTPAIGTLAESPNSRPCDPVPWTLRVPLGTPDSEFPGVAPGIERGITGTGSQADAASRVTLTRRMGLACGG